MHECKSLLPQLSTVGPHYAQAVIIYAAVGQDEITQVIEFSNVGRER